MGQLGHSYLKIRFYHCYEENQSRSKKVSWESYEELNSEQKEAIVKAIVVKCRESRKTVSKLDLFRKLLILLVSKKIYGFSHNFLKNSDISEHLVQFSFALQPHTLLHLKSQIHSHYAMRSVPGFGK